MSQWDDAKLGACNVANAQQCVPISMTDVYKRQDFSLKGFPGSTRLLELSHTMEEMKTICTCGRKATCTCRKVNGEFVFEGEQVAIDLENDVQYVSMCPQCYFKARRGQLKLF